MALLQPKLSLKVAQRQILTPGLMQMVSVLALNKLELKELINTEIVENPVLEELEESVPLIDDVALREAERDRSVRRLQPRPSATSVTPFDEIDFGSFASRIIWIRAFARPTVLSKTTSRRLRISFPSPAPSRITLLATGFPQPQRRPARGRRIRGGQPGRRRLSVG